MDYQLLYTSFFTDSAERNLNTPDPSTGLLGECHYRTKLPKDSQQPTSHHMIEISGQVKQTKWIATFAAAVLCYTWSEM